MKEDNNPLDRIKDHLKVRSKISRQDLLVKTVLDSHPKIGLRMSGPTR